MSIHIREPVVSGMFYPAGKDTLQKMIANFFSLAEPVTREHKKLFALMAPHAGYMYSGQCAAYAYKLLKGASYDTVIILGPSHYAQLDGASVWSKGFYRTPIDQTPIDEEGVQFLLQSNSGIEDYKIAHMQEHSLEVQLPFLQYMLKNKFYLIPLVIGNPTMEYTSKLADALEQLVKNPKKNYLVVCSTDLSHYHSNEVAKRMDNQIIEAIRRNKIDELVELIDTGKGEACGIGPILTLLFLFKKFNSKFIDILNVTNSGETSGDKSRVVGYMSAAFYI